VAGEGPDLPFFSMALCKRNTAQASSISTDWPSHAREWITTMTVEYLVYQLLTTYASDATTRRFLDSYDFYGKSLSSHVQ
jgi:hypothetical protein